MNRLNRSRRQRIGYTYQKQVQNNVLEQQNQRKMSSVFEQAFNQNMRGAGDEPAKIDLVTKSNLSAVNDQISKINFSSAPHRDKIPAVVVKPDLSSKPDKKFFSSGQSSIQPTVGGGVTDIASKNKEPILPGDLLRKKLLKKMTRERNMKSIGDRVKTSPIKDGFVGGSLVIPSKGPKGSAGGQSASKTLPGMKGYKLNPKPLIGAGQGVSNPKGGFFFTLAAIIAGISAAASSAAAVTVAGTTVGALVGAAATGAAGAAGAAVVKAIIGSGSSNPKKKILKAIKKTSITLNDFSTKDKIKLKVSFDKLKKNPTQAGLVSLGVKMAPVARQIMKKKLEKKINTELIGGSLSPAKKFDVSFVKHFVKELK
jgi:hypothetical protein